jgi:hypothetical protein
MVRTKEKGQGLTEFALVVPILLMLLLFAIDPFFKGVNIALGKYYTFQAAREASIFLADGTHSCDSWVRSHVSEPVLLMGTAWTLTISPCPADSSWSQVSGSTVTATFAWTQSTVWWQGPWTGQMETLDVFQ